MRHNHADIVMGKVEPAVAAEATPIYKIVVADDLHSAGWKLLRAAKDIDILGPFDCQDDLHHALKEADALLICSDTSVDAQLLDAAPKLKVIARAGARLDNVALDDATRRGILVIHVPDANVTAMVEYTFLLMLSLARNWGGQSEIKYRFGFQLSGKNLGIIGFGHQGRKVATRAQAFGMHVLAYDPYIDLSFARERGVEIVDLPELLARADLITLHTAYTQRTRKMINTAALLPDQLRPCRIGGRSGSFGGPRKWHARRGCTRYLESARQLNFRGASSTSQGAGHPNGKPIHPGSASRHCHEHRQRPINRAAR